MFSVRLDGRKDIPSVKPALSILHSVVKSMPFPLDIGIIKDVNWTHTQSSFKKIWKNYKSVRAENKSGGFKNSMVLNEFFPVVIFASQSNPETSEILIS